MHQTRENEIAQQLLFLTHEHSLTQTEKQVLRQQVLYDSINLLFWDFSDPVVEMKFSIKSCFQMINNLLCKQPERKKKSFS